MKILFITSPTRECGIYEYGEMLQEAVRRVLPGIEFTSIGPDTALARNAAYERSFDLICINHHAALHAEFLPKYVRDWNRQVPVIVIQHDTLETRQLMLERGLPDFLGTCAGLIVHEPVKGLVGSTPGMVGSRVHYVRQGILGEPAQLDAPQRTRPLVGTVGFPFPWKNYDLLCKCAAEAGWDVLLIAPQATVEQCEQWQELSEGRAEIIPQFLPRGEVVQRLSRCDATAFLYQTGNTGTSGAIRLGFAARRAVVAFKNRQVLDLLSSAVGLRAAMWCERTDEVVEALDALRNQGVRERQARWAQVLAVIDAWEVVALRIFGSISAV